MQYIIHKHNNSNMYWYNLGEDCSSSSTVSCFVAVHILNQLLDINKITRRWQLFRGTACVNVLSQSQSQSQRFQISLLLLQLWSLLSSLTVEERIVEERIITEAAHIVLQLQVPPLLLLCRPMLLLCHSMTLMIVLCVANIWLQVPCCGSILMYSIYREGMCQ